MLQKKFCAKEIIDPRPYAVGTIKETYEKFTHISEVLPAMGYGEQQVKDLEETINRSDCETIVIATPIDLTRVAKLNKPSTRIKYELQEVGIPTLRMF